MTLNKSQKKILKFLDGKKRPVRTKEITVYIKRSNSATLRNLHLLKDAGFIERKRIGRSYFWVKGFRSLYKKY